MYEIFDSEIGPRQTVTIVDSVGMLKFEKNCCLNVVTNDISYRQVFVNNEGDVIIDGQRLPSGTTTVIFHDGHKWRDVDGFPLKYATPDISPEWLASYTTALSAAKSARA